MKIHSLIQCAAVAAVLVFFAGCATIFPPYKPITQAEIVEMARQGATDQQILTRIRESGSAYRLTAKEIVDLHTQGVSLTVIDYMMQSYLDAVREDQRFADESYWRAHYDQWYLTRPRRR